jgi:hypothetical protein
MREDLGIIAGARASLYFDGKWENVDMDEIVALAEKGTDLVFIEKRGVIEIVSKYIGQYGIAFCNTQGHFTEYAALLHKILSYWSGLVDQATFS